MIGKIKRFFLQDFVRITSWSSISYAIRVAGQFVVSKVLAITVGPAGIAILGQMSNIAAIVQSFGSAGISLGVTKFVAEHETDAAQQRKVINNALKLVCVTSVVAALAMLVSFKYLGESFFKGNTYNTVLIVAGVSVIFFSINNVIIAVVNGLKLYKLYVILNTVNSVVGLLLSLVFINVWGLTGALYSVVLAPALLFFVTYLCIYKKEWFSFSFLFEKFDTAILKKLSRFSIMAINNAVVGTIGQIVLRNIIIRNTSIHDAGLWDAMTKLTTGYMMLLTVNIQVYFLPTLASITDSRATWRELMKANKIVIPLLCVALFFLYLFRSQVIMLLFTREFLTITDFFKYQLIGDAIKISSWIFAYIMYARAMTRQLIITDNVFTLTYIILAYFLVPHMQLKGVYIAYMVNSSLYFVFIFFFIRRYLFKKAK